MRNICKATRSALLALGGCAALAFSGPIAANPSGTTDVKPSTERSAILRRETDIDGSSNAEEARNARAAAQRGSLAKPGEDYTANALARCDPLSGQDKVACQARVMGFGGSDGSVEGGGILRWAETVVVPPDSGPVTIAPKTAETLVLVPVQR